jgi:hypothetical protein
VAAGFAFSMNRKVLSLTRTDMNRRPVGPLIVDIQFIKSLTDTYSLYSFGFDSQGNGKLNFMLVGDNCLMLFSLLDEMLTPNTTSPHPPVTVLTTADTSGNPQGTLQVTLAKVKTFIDRISLFSYSFVPDGASPLEFNLTSTDASAFISSFDSILLSNPPNPRY